MENFIMKRLIILTVLLCLAGNVYGAGFDCTKASTTVEHLVCNDAELSKMDDALVSAYTRIISQASDREAVKTAQKEWLKRRDACKDAACLKKVYTSRLTVLTSKVSTTKNTSTFVGEYKRYLHGTIFRGAS